MGSAQLRKPLYQVNPSIRLAFYPLAIAMLIGEAIRDIRYDQIDPDDLDLIDGK